MGWRKSLAGILFAALAACTNAVDENTETTAGQEGMKLVIATPERVEGSFTWEEVTLRFLSTHNDAGDELKFQTFDGKTLIDGKNTTAQKTMSVMDTPMSFSEANLYVPEADTDAALKDFILSNEAKILPWLSRTLGSLGITGAIYPASFSIHNFAIMMAQAHGIQLPPLPEKADSTIAPQDYYGGTSEYCRAYSNAWGSNCYGMCGPGCSCWHWVCGDCCNHYGCANHDHACRTCSWTNPGACAACASFSAFFTGGGCAHP